MTDQGAWYIQRAKDALCEGNYIGAKNFALAAEVELGEDNEEVQKLVRTVSKINEHLLLEQIDKHRKMFEDYRPKKEESKPTVTIDNSRKK